MTLRRLGLVVNPIAGMGGPIGLKGTDGWTAAELERLGALPSSGARAARALSELSGLGRVEVLTAAGSMGEESVTIAGHTPRVVHVAPGPRTTAHDTTTAVREMVRAGCDLVLFAGGDGTARDIARAVGQATVVLGIPTGVKMHSAAFAVSPTAAGALAAAFIADRILTTRDAEVVDLDEEAYRNGLISVRLFGYVKVPDRAESLQGSKVRSLGDDEAIAEIGEEIAGRLRLGGGYAIGPGTTAKAALGALGLSQSLLGVDLVVDGTVVGLDMSAADLLTATADMRIGLVVSPIGGQGHVFGRGNQQLSPQFLRRVGCGGIIIVASPRKLASMRGRPLFIDTGDRDLDRALVGYARVVTGRRREVVYALSD